MAKWVQVLGIKYALEVYVVDCNWYVINPLPTAELLDNRLVNPVTGLDQFADQISCAPVVLEVYTHIATDQSLAMSIVIPDTVKFPLVGEYSALRLTRPAPLDIAAPLANTPALYGTEITVFKYVGLQ